MPRSAALASLGNLAAPDAVARVSYRSQGNVLVVAGGDVPRARESARALATDLHVTLLGAGASPHASVAAWEGRVDALAGYLGEFTATLSGLSVAGAPAASQPTPARFDLVLDFSTAPLFAMRHPPQGYFHAPGEVAALEATLEELRQSVGEFEKPRFFHYRENLCAHSRSQVEGCNACIDICSTQAIQSDGDHVKVDPHLCMGCGACSTVCPSGAMGYQFPKVSDRGAQMKQLLSAFRHAGGNEACIVFHDGGEAAALVDQAIEEGALPPRALPLEAWNVAAIGLDLVLPALAFGASQVAIVTTPKQDPEYVAALQAQMAIGQAIVGSLGYAGRHFAVLQVAGVAQLEADFAGLAPAASVAIPATFLLSDDKRSAIEFAVEHLVRHAPVKVDEIALPAGSPFGEVRVDTAKCTLCMACVGACPESALMDGADEPKLRFLERNCVQCGLCENTCPEGAITLFPRLLLTPAAREARVLNEAQPFHCVSCNKPFGTRQMVDAMMGRLATHSMFSGNGALRRLQMCADCRVVDMMSNKNETSVLRLGADS